jgi:hypothetical protein
VATHEVTSLAMAVDAKGEHVTLAYGFGCQNCDAKVVEKATSCLKDTLKTQVRMYQPPTSDEPTSPVVLSEDTLDDTKIDAIPGGVRAAVGDASNSWLLIERSNGAMALMAAPVGAKDATSVKTVELTGYTALRGDSSSAFGTMNPGGQVVAGPNGKVRVVVRGWDPKEVRRPVALEISDFGISRHQAVSEEGEFAAMATSGDSLAGAITHAPRDPSSPDRQVVFSIEKVQPVESPVFGVPVAVWTEGLEFHVAIRNAAGAITLWDGKSTDELVKAGDDSACSAVTFDAKGSPVLLQIGTKDITLTTGGKPTTLKSFSDGAGLANKTSCALAVSDAGIHVAWTEADPNATTEDQGHATLIESWTLREGTVMNVLKTRHDTVKNSISNIR